MLGVRRRRRGSTGRLLVVASLVAPMLAGPRATATSPLDAGLAAVAGFALDTVEVALGTGTAVVEQPADAVLVTWEGEGPVTALVRSRGPAGWGPWVAIDDAPDEAPDSGAEGSPSARTVLGPVWTGPGTEAVEVHVGADRGRAQLQLLRTVDELVVDVLDAVGALVSALLEPVPGAPDLPAAERPAPPVLPPAAWGSPGWSYGTPGCGNGPETAPLQRAIVHHTVTPNGYGPADVPAMMRSMYYGHLARGWCDIAYNFVVDAFGRIWQARTGPVEATVTGGHAKGWNTGSVGIALLGQHQPGASPAVSAPTAEALGAVADVAAWKFRINGVAPEIVGHRDVGATSCPGELVYDHLGELRAAVGARL